MSAQTLALLGVALGALLAGGGSLLLAWRQETIEGRAGVHIIRVVLEKARDEVDRLSADARWGAPGQLPDSRTWDVYRGAVSARLPLATLEKVDRAMRRLDALNASADRASKRADDLESRVWEAAMKHDKEAVETLQKAPSPEMLDASVINALPVARDEFNDAYTALQKVAPGLRKKRTPKSAFPWVRWHWRPLVLLLGVVAIAGAALVLSLSQPSEISKVQDMLAAHLGNAVVTACDPIQNHDDRFSCVVVEKPQVTPCNAASGASRVPQRTASLTPVVDSHTTKCGVIDQALKYSAARQHDTDCIAFFETADAEVPTGANAGNPGFLARLKAKLGKATRSSNSSGDVPSVIVPGTAFEAGC